MPLSACDRKSDEVLLIDGYNLIKTDPLLNLDTDQIDLWERIFAQGRSEE